ncbi:hypothetical protein UlMin_014475 [Ulmus minor]
MGTTTKDLHKKKNKTKGTPLENPKLLKNDRKLEKTKVETEKDQSSEKKKRKRERENNVGIDEAVQISVEGNSIKTAKKKKGEKSPRKKKVKNLENSNVLVGKDDQLDTETEGGFSKQNGRSKKSSKTKKVKSLDKGGEANQNEVFHASSVDEDCLKGTKGKSKEAKKKKRKDLGSSTKDNTLQEKEGRADEEDVYLISSGDEDCSKGMKKWITEYHQSRPGLKILQQRIDDFIIAHEERLEQERKEKEALVAEDGWTVVTHHKGRKKTTDAETGITVGSVAQAVAENKLAKKKPQGVGPDFYRFQRKEAQRNEIMMLQSKFEQDRKRIQQLRAARKFRPY